MIFKQILNTDILAACKIQQDLSIKQGYMRKALFKSTKQTLQTLYRNNLPPQI